MAEEAAAFTKRGGELLWLEKSIMDQGFDPRSRAPGHTTRTTPARLALTMHLSLPPAPLTRAPRALHRLHGGEHVPFLQAIGQCLGFLYLQEVPRLEPKANVKAVYISALGGQWYLNDVSFYHRGLLGCAEAHYIRRQSTWVRCGVQCVLHPATARVVRDWQHAFRCYAVGDLIF